jgi:HEAT repeat protein
MLSMDADSFQTRLEQPSLFEFDDTSTEAMELFPAVWAAGEAIISPDREIRMQGLEQIAQSQAARFSPLIAYLLVTRLYEPEMELRSHVVNILADVLRIDSQGRAAPEAVRLQLINHLARMRTRQIYNLLQVLDFDPQAHDSVAVLLNACSFAGNHLSDILLDRKMGLSIRMRAVEMIGEVGYLDAIPVLERIHTRLEARLNGQQHMPFVTLDQSDEASLLPSIQTALELLHSI